ncbi:MSCRAMM family protein [Nocardioides bruguierae]|uniref:MSCRAMM family protein n=1 Tax=Nocardioides bruguierae TaxID=2945102 RepID=UPI00202138BA|nr:carboxypeptidase-like regulatory domain-containing protein [Nocardioides bruguierae]MCL8024165.1 carboxypeptidase-like regulatory domain-containing protein [Nocardioides bruguierae]
MPTPHRPARPALLLALVVLLGVALVPTGTASAADTSGATATSSASSSTTAERGTRTTVRGVVRNPDGVAIVMRWFTRDWTQIGVRRVRNDVYSLRLAPGVYHLQFSDKRPSYNTKKYAPTDVTVRVRKRTLQRNVRMVRGASVTGVVRNRHGKALASARVVAADAAENSFTTTADKRGRFAVTGLPRGSYSLFTWDRSKTWVARSTYVADLAVGEVRDVPLTLGTKAGKLLVDLRAGGEPISSRVTVTVVSRTTGQWWTVNARHGTANLAGLFPGRYTLIAPGYENYLPRTGAVEGGTVRAGRADLASVFRWTKQGGRVRGRVVSSDGRDPMPESIVRLLDSNGAVLDEVRTGSDGTFLVGRQLRTQKVTLQVIPSDNVNYRAFKKAGVQIRTDRITKYGTIAVVLRPTS